MRRAAIPVLMLALAGCAHQPGWQQVTEAEGPEGVTVHLRHDPDTGVFAYRGVIELDHPITTVLLALADLEHYPAWLFRCRTLEIRPDEWGPARARVVIDGRWPLADRDALLDNRLDLDPLARTAVIRSSAVSGVADENPGLVRMPELENVFRVEALGTDRARLTFSTTFDAGGHLPDWLVRHVAERVPKESLRALAHRLDETDQYRLRNLDRLPLSFAQLRAMLLSEDE